MTDADRSLFRGLIEQIQTRAKEHREFPGVPCQCESSWHADELEGWADQLSVVLSSLQVTEEKDVTRVEPGATSPSTGTTAK